MKLALSILVLLAVAWLLTLWRANAREAAAEAAYPPSGQFVTLASGQRIHAVVSGSGPDIVLIHGASGSVRDWTFEMRDRLATRYRVIALDRPGFGWSDPFPQGAGTITEQAGALQEAAALLGAERPVVLGHSYGGAVAIAWAAELPDTLSALVMLAGVSHTWDGGIDLLYRVTGRSLGAAIAVPLLTAWVSDGYVARTIDSVFAPQPAPAGYGAHFGPAMTLRRQTMRINAAERVGLYDEIAALMPSYATLPMPIEIVHGGADDIVPVRIHSQPLHETAPDTVLTVLDGIGHMPHHSAAEAVEAAIDRAAARAGMR